MRSHEWVAAGTALCRGALVELEGPSLLPRWTRKHVAAHLSLNAEAIGNLVRQWETSPYASARPVAGAAAPALQAAVAQAEQRLAEARGSDLARLMEQAFAASMAGRDLLGELRQDAEAALGRARARLAELET